MSNHPTILAAVDLDDDAIGIVRRAARLADRCDGLLVIAHIVDHRTGYECDQIPLVPAPDVEGDMVRYAHAWLTGLLHSLDVADATITVTPGSPLDTVCALAAERRPLYVVVGRSRWGLFSPFSDLAEALERAGCDCDLLVIAQSADVKPAGHIEGGRRRSAHAPSLAAAAGA